MQDHEFEEQVHLKMEAFNLPPSEAVWQEVERRLHEKEKRRRWIIWLPIFLIGTFAAGYLIIHHGDRTSLTPLTHEGNVAIRQPLHAGVTRLSPDSLGKSKTAETTINNNPVASLEKIKISVKAKSSVRLPVMARLHGDQQRTDNASGQSLSTIHDRNSNQDKNENNITQSLITEGYINTELLQPATGDIAKRELVPSLVNDLMFDKQRFALDAHPLVAGHMFPAPPVTLASAKKWSWGINIAGGRSSINTGRLKSLFGNALVADFFAQNAFSNGGVIRRASPLTPGASFSAGVFADRKISQRISIFVGLNANYYSTHHQVGAKIDNSFSSAAPSAPTNPPLQSGQLMPERYYLTGTNRYTNKYLFLELPVVIQTRILANRNSPLYWDLGVSLSRMISSNALQFDQATGVYYNDNSLFKKTQLNISTGLPVQLIHQKNFGLKLGPQIQYGTLDLFKNNTPGSRHMLFFGLKACVRLSNK